MKTKLSIPRNNNRYSEHYFDVPNTCPHCHQTATPRYLNAQVFDPDEDKNIGMLFRCSNCYEYFALKYYLIDHSRFRLVNYSYLPSFNYTFPDNINSVSPLFKEIYSQSALAESLGLDQIAGVGYRKSVEFLIKDYLIYFTEEDEDEIRSAMLGQLRSKITNKRIRALATVSNWIGTDETHYTRKYEGRDIEDMKLFISSLVYFVSSEVAAEEATKIIEEKTTKN